MAHIMAQETLDSGDGPICLVLAPTRELVQQIVEQAEQFCDGLGITTAYAYDGQGNRQEQAANLRGMKRSMKCFDKDLRGLLTPPEILVASPGRLMDFLSKGETNLKRVTYFVLDEADRMLDMGFKDHVRAISGQIRPDRQTLMWSATMQGEVGRLAHEVCRKDAIHIEVATDGNSTNKDVVRIASEEAERARLKTEEDERAHRKLVADVAVAIRNEVEEIFGEQFFLVFSEMRGGRFCIAALKKLRFSLFSKMMLKYTHEISILPKEFRSLWWRIF